MALREKDRENFELLQRAFANNQIGLVETVNMKGEYVALLIIMVKAEGDEYHVMPMAEMIQGDFNDLYVDPAKDNWGKDQ